MEGGLKSVERAFCQVTCHGKVSRVFHNFGHLQQGRHVERIVLQEGRDGVRVVRRGTLLVHMLDDTVRLGHHNAEISNTVCARK